MGAALATAGYSGTPLAAKLGLKDGMHAAFLALPEQLAGLSEAVRFATVEHFTAWADVDADASCDVVHAFTDRRNEVEGSLGQLQAAIKRDGMIWVSWPKKASKVPTDVTEDVIRAEALKLDLVDVKVAAIDEIWSGLKLVIRKDRR
ncbi:DUF3052 family protein [Mesorhizobium sp. NPDC059054]|uniref:DUF3052 family protein n=1 Tax=unclassified Mesorhizobium TaxID=325217 RepID=UPI0006C746ED|nr:DUF3052 family protein [Mesorhizobium sp. 1M-11]